MPLSNPPQVRVIYAECNSPAAGSQSSPGYLFDTWYDKVQDDITASRDAVLSTLGLSYNASDGRLTALLPVVISVTAELTVDATPGGACTVSLSTPDYLGSPSVAVADPNTIGSAFPERVIVMDTADWFGLTSTCANGSDTPITYASMAIVRLV